MKFNTMKTSGEEENLLSREVKEIKKVKQVRKVKGVLWNRKISAEAHIVHLTYLTNIIYHSAS